MMTSGVTSSITAYTPSARGSAGSRHAPDEAALSEADQQALTQLEARDKQVRAHEQAHVSAGGELITSRASFTYQVGPDSKRYAVAGEVSIDTSPGSTPEETLERAARIRAAALAPADPSAQDRQVAAQADRMATEARQELNAQDNAEPTRADRRETALARLVSQVSATPSEQSQIDTYA
ncbi:MAG: hypothetical protein CVU19_13935 [Betaproteobacteria bacterium HGW-Betaproteobacteria-13]|jgi:hypothetical protein|nr:MAG: hypothetical protein CVU25_02115 [Betaproteobacteria bacterium HGW-Betaproteobacteria-19]PKO80147.1 MAG: hypothetical protein CVU19_13935 [Betaproteobacteria bacterium HGW-Betaproteobacteria-13]